MGFQSKTLSGVEGPMIGKADLQRFRVTFQTSDNPLPPCVAGWRGR